MKINTTNVCERRYTGRMVAVLIACLFAGAYLLNSSSLFAQAAATGQKVASTETASPTDAEFQLLHQDVRAKRRQIVAATLPLTTEESAKFWPVYDQYTAEATKISEARYKLVKDYGINYTSMTDAKASELIRRVAESDKAMIDLRIKYIPILEKALPEKKAAMFAQIDRRIQLMIDIELAGQVPLVNPR